MSKSKFNGLQEHHIAWLLCHPHRGADWLRGMLCDGFQIHHIDGNHGNNDPQNLILVEWRDHARLHGCDDFMLAWPKVMKLQKEKKEKPYRKVYHNPAGPSTRLWHWGTRLTHLESKPEHTVTERDRAEIASLRKSVSIEFKGTI